MSDVIYKWPLMQSERVNDEICRDLILPCVYALAQFIESVKIKEKNG